jgi:hypothetical protein
MSFSRLSCAALSRRVQGLRAVRARAAPVLRRRLRSPSPLCRRRSRQPGVNAAQGRIQHNRLLPGSAALAAWLLVRATTRTACAYAQPRGACKTRLCLAPRSAERAQRVPPCALNSESVRSRLRRHRQVRATNAFSASLARCASRSSVAQLKGSPRSRGRRVRARATARANWAGGGTCAHAPACAARGRADSLCVHTMRFAHGVHVQAAGAPDITDRCVQCEPARRRCAARWPAWSSSAASDGQHATRGYVECGASRRIYPGRLPGRGGLDARCGLLQRPQNARRSIALRCSPGAARARRGTRSLSTRRDGAVRAFLISFPNTS